MFGVWAAIPFVTSLLLLGGYLGFRLWEEKRGTRFFASFRDKADVQIEEAYKQVVTGNISAEYRQALIVILKKLTHVVIVLAAQGLRRIERSLIALSHRLRRGVPQANGKGPSEFLKTITPNKKQETSTTNSGETVN